MSQSTATSGPTFKNPTSYPNSRSDPNYICSMLTNNHNHPRATMLRPATRKRKNTSFLTILIYSHWSRNLPFAITARTCNTGRGWSCEICVAKTILAAGFDNVHITSAGNGKSSQDSLPNAGAADGRNIAAKSVRKVPGCSTGTGVWLLRNDTLAFEKKKEKKKTRRARGEALSPRATTLSTTPYNEFRHNFNESQVPSRENPHIAIASTSNPWTMKYPHKTILYGTATTFDILHHGAFLIWSNHFRYLCSRCLTFLCSLCSLTSWRMGWVGRTI